MARVRSQILKSVCAASLAYELCLVILPVVALQFHPMLFTGGFLTSVTSDLQCCCIVDTSQGKDSVASREREILLRGKSGIQVLSPDASSFVAELLSNTLYQKLSDICHN